jgi:hypothetical protein
MEPRGLAENKLKVRGKENRFGKPYYGRTGIFRRE